MVIVGGTFEFDPELRDKFIESRGDMMRTSRGEAGCIEYTFCADPLDPSRVVLFEKWADQASLDAHIAAQRGSPTTDRARHSTDLVVDHALRRRRRALPLSRRLTHRG